MSKHNKRPDPTTPEAMAAPEAEMRAVLAVDLRENAFLAAIARDKTFAYPGTETRTITSAEDACTFETRLVSAKTFEDVPVVAQRVVNIQAGEKKGGTMCKCGKPGEGGECPYFAEKRIP